MSAARGSRLGDELVVEAKLVPPLGALTVVPRTALWAALDDAARYAVTTVTAPPGAGKTLLLASWARRVAATGIPDGAGGAEPAAVAWASLDADDVDPVRLWSHLVAAVVRTGALPVGSPLHEALISQVGLDQAFEARLLNSLLRLQKRTVLVLDDVHEIAVPGVPIDPLLGRLLERMPPMLRVVLSGRAEAALPLHRARLAGEVVDIAAESLGFDVGETRELLLTSGVVLPDAEVARLRRETEGWAAGLRMRALALQPRAGRAAAVPRPAPGTSAAPDGAVERPGERAIDDFLLAEVLDRQPAPVRDLLVRTSVLDRVCPELADALTGRTDAASVLAGLDRAGAFVSAVGGSAVWYRYHQLLLDALRRLRERELPGETTDLHRRAAEWFAANGQVLDAVRHAVAALDWGLVTRLVTDDAWRLVLAPDGPALDRLMARVPGGLDLPGPGYPLLLALRAVEARQVSRTAQLLAEVRARMLDADDEERRALDGVVTLVEMINARWVGRAEPLLHAADAALEALDTAALPASPDIRLTALSSRATGLCCSGRLVDANLALQVAMAQVGRSGVDLPVQNTLSYLSLTQALRGDVRTAATTAAQARDFAAERGWRAIMQLTPGLLAEAVVHYEEGDDAACATALDLADSSYAADPEPVMLVLLRCRRALLDLARGAPRHGLQRLGGLDTVAERVSPWALAELCAVRSALLLACDEPRAALAVVDARRQPAAVAARARALVALDDHRRARRALRPILEEPPPQRHWAADAMLTDTVAAALDGDFGTALSVAGRLQAFLHDEPCRQVVLRAAEVSRHLAPAVADDATLVDRLPPALRTVASPPRPEGAPALTTREAAVLQFLPSLLTAEEVADRLSVSPNTVRTQIRQVYRKLGANRRSEAVERARQLGLL